MSQNLILFQQLGPEKFAAAVVQLAPFFGTIDPEFIALQPGRAEIRIRNQRKVHNHIGTINVIALCNGAELAAGTCTDVSIPAGARWLPIGMNVQYHAKAKTDIRITTEAETLDWSQQGNLDVPVAGYDTDGAKVFSCIITMNIKH